jgi:hypothetical protein
VKYPREPREFHVRNVAGDIALTAFAPALPSPLRKTAPYGRPVHRLGDRAGRSPGSRVVVWMVRPSQLPSGRMIGPQTRRSQLRGQPRIASNSGLRTRSVRVPSFVPDLTRGTSTPKCSLEHARKSSRIKIFDPWQNYARRSRKILRVRRPVGTYSSVGLKGSLARHLSREVSATIHWW